jgi:hypothetical protein
MDKGLIIRPAFLGGYPAGVFMYVFGVFNIEVLQGEKFR